MQKICPMNIEKWENGKEVKKGKGKITLNKITSIDLY